MPLNAVLHISPPTSAYSTNAGCTDVIELVRADNFYGNMGTIGRANGWRADRQRPLQNAMNIQVQKDGVGPPSTCACVIVPNRYSDEAGQLQNPDRLAQVRALCRHRELTRVIRRALNLSKDSLRPNPSRARQLFNETLPRLHDPNQRDLAQSELDKLGPAPAA